MEKKELEEIMLETVKESGKGKNSDEEEEEEDEGLAAYYVQF